MRAFLSGVGKGTVCGPAGEGGCGVRGQQFPTLLMSLESFNPLSSSLSLASRPTLPSSRYFCGSPYDDSKMSNDDYTVYLPSASLLTHCIPSATKKIQPNTHPPKALSWFVTVHWWWGVGGWGRLWWLLDLYHARDMVGWGCQCQTHLAWKQLWSLRRQKLHTHTPARTLRWSWRPQYDILLTDLGQACSTQPRMMGSRRRGERGVSPLRRQSGMESGAVL